MAYLRITDCWGSISKSKVGCFWSGVGKKNGHVPPVFRCFLTVWRRLVSPKAQTKWIRGLRGVSCVMSLFLFGGGVFDMTEVFRGHKMMVIYLPFCGCLGGPTFIPNPVMCYQLRLGVCEKNSRFFSLWTIFSTTRNPDSFFQLGRVGLSEPWSFAAKTSTERINSMMPKRGHSKFLEFFQNPIFSTKKIILNTWSFFSKIYPKHNGRFFGKKTPFLKKNTLSDPCRITQCRSVVCAWGPLLSDAFRGFRRGGFFWVKNVKIFQTTTELMIYNRKSQNHHETITLQKSKGYK